MSKKPLLILLILTFLSSLLFWLTFHFNLPAKIGFPAVSLETIYANYDGPNYMAISICGYHKDCLGPSFSLPQPLEYYPAHFPGYPLIIRLFSTFSHVRKAMLLATLTGSLALTAVSFRFFKIFLSPKASFWLTFLLLFFPPRFFILRQIGAPETWFLAAILASLSLFTVKKYWLAAATAAFAQALKTPAILLLATYGLFGLYRRQISKLVPFVLVPLVIIAIFSIYRQQTGNFWAYFHSGDNFHLTFLPYSVFISSQSWINTIWLEEIIYIYFIAIYACYRLIKKYKISPVALFPAVFTLATLFVAHRDISRYIAPVYPFVFLAFAKFLTKKPVKIIMLLLLPAVWLYAINFVIGNTAPIADWSAYL